MKIRQNDLVVVISGNDVTSTPHKVTAVHDGGKKITVEGINLVWRHVRPGHPKSPQGGRLHVEAPIDASNVMLYCDSCAGPVRVGYSYDDEGAKNRVCKKCNYTFSRVSPPREQYAKG